MSLEFFCAGGDLFRHAKGKQLFDVKGQRLYSALLAVDNRTNELIWYASGGSKVLKRLVCDSKPLDAVVCEFPKVSGRNYAPDDDQVPARTSALAVLVTADVLQLHLVNGQVFDVHLPVKVARIFATGEGLLLQRKILELETMTAASLTIQSHHSQFSERFDPSIAAQSGINSGFLDGNQTNSAFNANFDVKNWLDETIDLGGTLNAPLMMDIGSPSFARTFNTATTMGSSHGPSDKDDMLSTRSSLPDILEQYVQVGDQQLVDACEM